MIYKSKFVTIGEKHEVTVIADDAFDDLTVKITSETYPGKLPITMTLTGPMLRPQTNDTIRTREMLISHSPWLCKETLDALGMALWIGWQAIIMEIRASPKAIEAAEQMQPIPEGQR